MKAVIHILVLCLSPIAMMGNGAAPSSDSERNRTAVVPVTLSQSVVSLTGPWKFNVGDNPRWAGPDFDDSDWQSYELMHESSALTLDQLTDAPKLPGWQQHGHPAYTGYAWYRVRLSVPGDGRGLALLMPAYVEDAYEVYLNGSKIGAFAICEDSCSVHAGFSTALFFQYLWQNHRGFVLAAELGGSFESYLRSQIVPKISPLSARACSDSGIFSSFLPAHCS